MRPEEAQLISDFVTRVALPAGSVCLNVGSSTKFFREVDQPHIHSKLIIPLEAIGIRFVHCDLKMAEGVDLIGNVLDLQFQQRMAERQADVLLCCNILEHLESPQVFADACAKLVRPRGYMVVSIPFSYPYHADPIDTMLRLAPVELAALFPGWEFVQGEVVKSQTFLQEMLSKPRGAAALARHLLKAMVPFYRPRQWRANAHRLLWLFRPYTVSVALLRKPPD